jgi:hypothetical protein
MYRSHALSTEVIYYSLFFNVCDLNAVEIFLLEPKAWGEESCVCLCYCEYSKLPPEGRGCRAEDGIETASPATESLHNKEKILKN